MKIQFRELHVHVNMCMQYKTAYRMNLILLLLLLERERERGGGVVGDDSIQDRDKVSPSLPCFTILTFLKL